MKVLIYFLAQNLIFFKFFTGNTMFQLALNKVDVGKTKAFGIYKSRSIKHEFSQKDLDEKS